MSDPTQPPIVVPSSPLVDQVKQGAASLVFMLSGFGLLAHYLPPDVVRFVESQQFLSALGGVAAFVVFVWRQIETRIKKKQMVIAAEAAPDHVAVVVPSKSWLKK